MKSEAPLKEVRSHVFAVTAVVISLFWLAAISICVGYPLWGIQQYDSTLTPSTQMYKDGYYQGFGLFLTVLGMSSNTDTQVKNVEAFCKAKPNDCYLSNKAMCYCRMNVTEVKEQIKSFCSKGPELRQTMADEWYRLLQGTRAFALLSAIFAFIAICLSVFAGRYKKIAIGLVIDAGFGCISSIIALAIGHMHFIKTAYVKKCYNSQEFEALKKSINLELEFGAAGHMAWVSIVLSLLIVMINITQSRRAMIPCRMAMPIMFLHVLYPLTITHNVLTCFVSSNPINI
jgi:hypothetical protein